LKGKFLGRLTMMAAASAALMLTLSGAAKAATPGGVTPQAVGANLTTATVTFNTLDDNKDSDTLLTVQVLDVNGRVDATASGFFGEFANGSSHPIPLRVRPGVKWETLVGGNLKVSIQPNGDDTWKFGFVADLEFDDFDFSITTVERTSLSEDPDKKTKLFPLQF